MYIAFTGKKGHGKTTAARVLEKQGYAHLNFADPVKKIGQIAYGLTDEEMSDAVLKETPLDRWPYKTPRELLQQIGTDMFRHYLPETWTRAQSRRKAEAIAVGKPGVTCSDLRFLNEEEHVRAEGGVIIRVFDPRKQEDEKDEGTKHISETEMDLIRHDFEIINDGSINELHSKVMDVFDKLALAQEWAPEVAKEIDDDRA